MVVVWIVSKGGGSMLTSKVPRSLRVGIKAHHGANLGGDCNESKGIGSYHGCAYLGVCCVWRHRRFYEQTSYT